MLNNRYDAEGLHCQQGKGLWRGGSVLGGGLCWAETWQLHSGYSLRGPEAERVDNFQQTTREAAGATACDGEAQSGVHKR